MRIGIVSDLHCNQHGLLRALDIMGDLDELICLGDSVYEYRFSNEVIEILRDRAWGIRSSATTRRAFSARRASWGPRSPTWIDPCPARRGRPHRPPRLQRSKSAAKSLLLVHSTPWEPRGDLCLPADSSLIERFAEADADLVLYGHYPTTSSSRRVGRVLVINPGSAGQVLANSGNGRQLSCAVLTP